jgi:hypothetical protein
MREVEYEKVSNWQMPFREAGSLALVAVMFLFAVLSWNEVHVPMAVHWNALGEVNGTGGRFFGLLVFPLIGLGIYVITLLPKFNPDKPEIRRSVVYEIVRIVMLASWFLNYIAEVRFNEGLLTNPIAMSRIAVGMFLTAGATLIVWAIFGRHFE